MFQEMILSASHLHGGKRKAWSLDFHPPHPPDLSPGAVTIMTPDPREAPACVTLLPDSQFCSILLTVCSWDINKKPALPVLNFPTHILSFKFMIITYIYAWNYFKHFPVIFHFTLKIAL